MFFDLTWQKGPKKEKQNLNFKKTKQFHSILVCLFFSKVFICVWYPLALIRFSSFILKRGLKVKQTQSHKLHIFGRYAQFVFFIHSFYVLFSLNWLSWELPKLYWQISSIYVKLNWKRQKVLPIYKIWMFLFFKFFAHLSSYLN